jgi:hypothetical protein
MCFTNTMCGAIPQPTRVCYSNLITHRLIHIAGPVQHPNFSSNAGGEVKYRRGPDTDPVKARRGPRYRPNGMLFTEAASDKSPKPGWSCVQSWEARWGWLRDMHLYITPWGRPVQEANHSGVEYNNGLAASPMV